MLPRFSALYKAGAHVALRAGGGYGYKAPTIFANATEQQACVGVRALNTVRAETSRGLNADMTLKGLIGDLGVVLNQAAFYTRLEYALIPNPALQPLGTIEFANSPLPITARGLETNLRLNIEDLQFFTAYTFTDTRQTYDLSQPAQLPFVSKHRLVLTTVYEHSPKTSAWAWKAPLMARSTWARATGRGAASGCWARWPKSSFRPISRWS